MSETRQDEDCPVIKIKTYLKIKPCLCGNKDVSLYNGIGNLYYVMCCIPRCWIGPKEKSEESAVDGWNERNS